MRGQQASFFVTGMAMLATVAQQDAGRPSHWYASFQWGLVWKGACVGADGSADELAEAMVSEMMGRLWQQKMMQG